MKKRAWLPSRCCVASVFLVVLCSCTLGSSLQNGPNIFEVSLSADPRRHHQALLRGFRLLRWLVGALLTGPVILGGWWVLALDAETTLASFSPRFFPTARPCHNPSRRHLVPPQPAVDALLLDAVGGCGRDSVLVTARLLDLSSRYLRRDAQLAVTMLGDDSCAEHVHALANSVRHVFTSVDLDVRKSDDDTVEFELFASRNPYDVIPKDRSRITPAEHLTSIYRRAGGDNGGSAQFFYDSVRERTLQKRVVRKWDDRRVSAGQQQRKKKRKDFAALFPSKYSRDNAVPAAVSLQPRYVATPVDPELPTR